MKVEKNVKALVLLSGGLDSMLAAKILMEQGVEVTGISFESCFFGTEKAEKAARGLGIPLIKVDFKKEHLEMLKNPKSGYGKSLNPCIDCHALMIKIAGQTAAEKKFDFLATGEVLGQRPMSQNRNSLNRVKKLAGVEVLRPLSALLLPETEIEKKKLVKREELLNIGGRGRKKQKDLAEKFGIRDYPSPAGGCILTEKEFGARLKEMFLKFPECEPEDTEILKYGRVFWISSDKPILILVGRDKEENEILEKMTRSGDAVMKMKDIAGPATIISNFACLPARQEFRILNQCLNFKIKIPSELNFEKLNLNKIKNENEILKIAGLLTGWYSAKARGREVEIEVSRK